MVYCLSSDAANIDGYNLFSHTTISCEEKYAEIFVPFITTCSAMLGSKREVLE